MADVPAGYAAGRERGAAVVALPSAIAAVGAAIAEAGTLYGWAASRPDAQRFTGRGSAYGVTTAEGAWVVRHFRRGGVVARVLHDRYLRLGTPRPLRELQASTRARQRGVATPEVIAAVTYRAGPLYRGDLATRLIPDSFDLAEAVLGARRLDADRRAAAWRAAGALLRTAFDAGVVHADLNLRNILIQSGGDGVRAHLIDLDRAEVRDRAVGDAPRAAILDRLHRSRRKLEAAFGTSAGPGELSAFDAGLRDG
jgi:3-deoxy-D-manno-octulosonic acid kinase